MNLYEGDNHFFRRQNTLLSCHFGVPISSIIVKRGQDVAQKFSFCVPEMKESNKGLERHTKVMSK